MKSDINPNASPVALFWHRRDLRVHDNVALFHALKSSSKVLPLFIFDTDILHKLDNKHDARVEFIYLYLKEIKRIYEQHQGSLLVRIGKPLEVFSELLNEFRAEAVFAGNDYEPYAIQRDNKVKELLQTRGINFRLYKDHVIFEKDEVVKADGKPYTVYTPYMRRWKETLKRQEFEPCHSEKLLSGLHQTEPLPFPTLEETGFLLSGTAFPDAKADIDVIRNYHLQRDLPAKKGTSRLGIHLRFGTVSTQELVQMAMDLNETWLNELIWREFFQMILYHFPHTTSQAFKPAYNRIQWLNNETHFKAWCEGKTGFPIVDAGMRELAETGFMHNRVRMITGSFLVKDLLIDWRWGEAWFAEKLLDYEQASNVGNWQWVAGCGCDAAPYFRVFNPELQAKKFDPHNAYIRQWIPELDTPQYPEPVVDHAGAKIRALKAYKEALNVD
jgi:deoxyribodipyrimidine photo-lyase